MRSSFFKFSILLSLGLIALLLNACALDAPSDPSDPPGGCGGAQVTPDTYVPSTVKVCVTVTEDQDASDGALGSSDVKLQFDTNEISEMNTIIFHGESITCVLNGVMGHMALGSATEYSFHVAISTNPTSYSCTYFYPGGSETIFSFSGPPSSLSPALVRPVAAPATNFMVHYTPGPSITNSSNCMVQVIANAPDGSVMGNTMSQNTTIAHGDIYTGGMGVSALSGSGNIAMTRTCTPINFDNHNAADDIGPRFDAVNVTYTSKASSEVTWVPPSTT